MRVISSREVLAVTVAAAAGAACAARWWAGRGVRSGPRAAGEVGDRVEELHLAFRDRVKAAAGIPEDVLRLYWSQLYPLELEPTDPARPVAPTA
ncbi:hypothetical protein OG739_34250 [Streptomyces longwoodensis]|uniref:hypothetical protein n=1 Tax=Streptomyces longwoodensis TaxID=68231 RepID=UPI00225868EF|nr:hypothetical protein [Streptomyces longwoodensis]MCX4997757.1 hypothetical protein [Streptomyces longwoodensis]WRY92364.1 hypothetical protein OG481_29385 [Streptomyces longwoodensis]WTI43362.1 hypothetical protein OG547_01965 [Streptomyces longwoodensis]WUC69653.1 hypothetical protein OG416_01945 [Streptomyces longwoodensis]